MYVRRRLDERDLICPRCESPQESPGSTVCEQCGADLRRPGVKRSSSPHPVVRLPHLLQTPVPLLRQGTATLLWVVSAVSFIFRSIALLALLASLIIAVLFDPDVHARVPMTKGMATAATTWIQRAEEWSGQLMAMWGVIPFPSGTPSLSARTRQPARVLAASPTAGSQVALLITSTPSGATVRLGTRQVGRTPVTLKVAPGIYKVTISRPGYATVSRTVTVREGRALSLGLSLTAAPKSPQESPPPKLHKGDDS